MHRAKARLAAVLALLSFWGCHKGCFSSWLAQRGVGEQGSGGGRTSLPLQGVDCPDGMARCSDGVVQASRAFSYPIPCPGPPERCTCPWDNLASCARGCCAEGVEIAMARAHAVEQLCAPNAANVYARPPPIHVEAQADWCQGELYRCAAGNVVACGEEDAGATETAVPLAACLRGCAEEGVTIDDEGVSRDAAIAILCAH